jgi:hypothetical protein
MPEASLYTTARRTFPLLGSAALVVAALYCVLLAGMLVA